ncbi:hypothetical protein D3C78_1658390 [compost metagenome]
MVTNIAICAACSAKMPKLSRCSSRLRSTAGNRAVLVPVSEWKLECTGSGMMRHTPSSASSASTPVSTKMPSTPI